MHSFQHRLLSACLALLVTFLYRVSTANDIDILFVGGTVFDGSGTPGQAADVGVVGDRIVFVGDRDSAGLSVTTIIDASGLWITPGFIDAHSHAELDKPHGKAAKPYLYQGITTVVLGLDGGGTHEIAARQAAWRLHGIGVNGLLFVGHGAVRRQVMGLADRDPRPRELLAMQQLVRQAMREGAFGLSSGLFYVPGTYASTDEVIEVAKVAAEFPNAIYDTHDRDLGAVYGGIGYDASVREAIEIGSSADLRMIFSHYNLQGRHNYGRGEQAADYINDARAAGVDVWAAQHPYNATQSNLRAYTIPSWAADGGHAEMLRRFDDARVRAQIETETKEMLTMRGGAEKILFADPRPSLNGKTLADVARELELSPAAAVQTVLRDGNAVVMNLELYDDANTWRLAREPWMMTCTDGREPPPGQRITHPRTYGAFPMKMRKLVLDDGQHAPEFVVRSFSGLAADFYRLEDRGYVRNGYAADLVVLDPRRYRDVATYEAPREFAAGVVHVLVNGQFAIRDEVHTDALAGRPVMRPVPTTTP